MTIRAQTLKKGTRNSYAGTSNLVAALSAGAPDPLGEKQRQKTPHHVPVSVDNPEALSALLLTFKQ